jgi:hypothetical protein
MNHSILQPNIDGLLYSALLKGPGDINGRAGTIILLVNQLFECLLKMLPGPLNQRIQERSLITLDTGLAQLLPVLNPLQNLTQGVLPADFDDGGFGADGAVLVSGALIGEAPDAGHAFVEEVVVDGRSRPCGDFEGLVC